MTNAPKTVHLVLAILTIFVAGAVAGGFFGARIEHKRFEKQCDISNLPDTIATLLTKRLSLNKEQKSQITPLVNQACSELETVYKDSSDRITGILDRYYEKLSPFLEDQQTRILEDMEEELRTQAAALKEQ